MKTLNFLVLMGLVFGSCVADDPAMNGDDGQRETADAPAFSDGLPVDFYVQCRDSRCDFGMREGDAVEYGAPTWHRYDTGVRLAGDPVVLSRTDLWAGHEMRAFDCYRIRLLGFWEETVDVYLEFDIAYGVETSDGDPWGGDPLLQLTGEIFYHRETLERQSWKLQELEVATPRSRANMRFTLRKEGQGDMVLYFVEVDGRAFCEGDEIRVD